MSIYLKIITGGIWALAIIIGVGLFATSKKVQNAESKLYTQQKNIVQQEERIAVLNAEWHYLNNPQRLEQLAGHYWDESLQEKRSRPIILAGAPELPAEMMFLSPPQKPARAIVVVEETNEKESADEIVLAAAVPSAPPRSAVHSNPRQDFQAMLISYSGGQ